MRKFGIVAICLLLLTAVGVAGYKYMNKSGEHGHEQGANGGIIVSVGPQHWHVEAVFTDAGVIKLFTLGQDQTKVITVPIQDVTAYIRSARYSESSPVVLKPERQAGDPDGETSLFVGQLPDKLLGSQLIVVVPNMRIAGERYRFSMMTPVDEHATTMPPKVTDDAERQLFLTAGGKYTEADIKANGSTTASEKYREFRSAHDMHPQPGDRICPITQTKANPKCTWIVGGQDYQFCCPPCIDEFVKLAKGQPGDVKLPQDYIKK